MGYPSLSTIIDSVKHLTYADSDRALLRTNGLWHVLIFLRHRRLNGGGSRHEFNAHDLSEASFDINGLYLPVTQGSRNVYYEPGATQGNSPEKFFRHLDGPRQTYLNRIYTGLTGAGPRQPLLFNATSRSLPTTISLDSNWIAVLRSSGGNTTILDERIQDLITFIFRFGQPILGRDTASIAIHEGNGTLRLRPGISLASLPTSSSDITELVSDYLGLSSSELRRLMPAVTSVDPSEWAENSVAGFAELGDEMRRVFLSESASTGGMTASSTASRPPVVPIELNERIKRMVRLAIASYPAVILVGPPGTGKTTLIKQILNDLQSDFIDYGFTRAPSPAKWVTPDESWTARDLVGGITLDERSQLRFRPGYILDAIRADQWLVLDEANRADMDKIFGGLLTWLSESPVELGKASTAMNAPVVELGWRDEPENLTIGVERLEEEPFSSSDPIRFLAGREWRLLGTYNPLDAQRVFRFGQALARRFVEIPIPAPSVTEFSVAFAPQVADLPAEINYKLTKIYEAHWSEVRTQLGPAIFFKAIPYIRNSLSLPAIASLNNEEAAVEEIVSSADDLESLFADIEVRGEGDSSEATNVEAAQGETEVSTIAQIVTEAYLAAAGKYLAKLEEEELDRLGERIIASGAFARGEWEWIKHLLPDLA